MSKEATSEPKMLCTQEEFEKLLIDNQKFPYSIVNKEFKKYNWDIKEDLYSAAMAGMVYAATKYDPKRSNECKFISFAVYWIRYYIYEEIRKLYPVKFNQSFITKRKKIINFIDEYKKSHNDKEPTTECIAKKLGISEKVVNNTLNVNGCENFQFLSFNMPTENEKSNSESEQVTNDKLVKEYLDNDALVNSPTLSYEVKDLIAELKKRVPEEDYLVFYDYYMNGENFSDLAKKYKLRFPSSAAYLIKKCENECRKILAE